MDSKKLIIRLAEEKTIFLDLTPEDLKRATYYLLVLCHIALRDFDPAAIEDPSDYDDFNSFVSREVIEPTLDVFLDKLKCYKEVYLRFHRPNGKGKAPGSPWSNFRLPLADLVGKVFLSIQEDRARLETVINPRDNSRI